MAAEAIMLPVADVVYRDDLYPRLKTDPATVQKYAANIEVLPAIEVNQHHELIDGWHRWTAHRKAGAEMIPATVTETRSDVELLALACQRNAAHGIQLAEDDKRRMAIRLFASGTGLAEQEIERVLSVSRRTVSEYLRADKEQLRAERDAKIRALWLACHTLNEISEAVGVPLQTVHDLTATFPKTEALPKSEKLLAEFNDADWKPPLFDLWSQHKNTNEVEHFGNSPQEHVENLLYLYTEPFGIVVDPFAGGGSTIDVCLKRSRRCWASDRKPIPEREKEIRQHDLVNADGSIAVSGPAQWKDVQLVYLDPPYWRQAEGEYSTDATDLGNMTLDQFTATLAAIVNGYAAKLKPGAHIALLIQPTQWKADDRAWPSYHDLDIIRAASKRLRLQYHLICPYSTEQSNAQQVEDAKETKRLLVRTRRLVVWEVIEPGRKDRLERPELQQVAPA